MDKIMIIINENDLILFEVNCIIPFIVIYLWTVPIHKIYYIKITFY